jgi:predicted RNA-binding protein YlqC (UPF0109 family)
MKEFIEYIVKNLVDQPDAVHVECLSGESNLICEIRCAKADVGKVVGKRGRTIKAIRTIAMMTGARIGQRVRVELIEEGKAVVVEGEQSEEQVAVESEEQEIFAEATV